MKWEYRTSEGAIINSGTGITVSSLVLGGSNNNIYEDACFIRFYSDVNNTGKSEDKDTNKGNNPKVDSPKFKVVKKKTHSLTLDLS